MTTPTNAKQLSPYAVYSVVVSEAIRNALFAAASTAFFYWFAGVWRFGSVLAFSGAALVVALDGVSVTMTTVAGVAMVFTRGQREPESGWMWAANVVRIASLAFALYLLSVLYHRLWP
jgi:hypothetical protein